MLAGLQRFQHDRFVLVGWQANIDQIDVRIGQKIVVIRILLDLRQIDLPAARPEIPLDADPVARQFLLVASRDGGHFGTAELPRSREMGVTHEADADDSDAYHLFFLFPWAQRFTSIVVFLC